MSKPANIFAPPRRSLRTSRAVKKVAAPKEPIFTLEYFVCFFSFTMLLYSSVAGTKAIIGFLVPWSLIILKRFFSIPHVLQKSWPLLLLPAWSTASALWSVEPAWSFRSGLEFFLTVAVGILAAYCIKPKTLIIGLLSALMVIALICVAQPGTLAAASENSPVAGIFGSKNAFSAVISLLAFVSIAVLMDKDQPLFFRAASIGGLALSPILLYLGRSLDAILSVCFTIIIFLAVRFLARFDHKIRLMVGIFILLSGLSLTLFLSFAEFDPVLILNALGKDATLTGRTHLWSRAIDFIAERPILGIGCNAFWRMDNLGARELWYSAGVPMGAGFNFHNEYLDAWVGLGVVGFGMVLGYLFVVSKRVIKGILGSMSPEQYFAFLLFIPYIIRSLVETGIFGPFNLNMVLFCIVWKYFQPPKPVPAKPFGLPERGKNFVSAKKKTAS